MASTERPYDRGLRRGARALVDLGEEYRNARLSLGLSQREVAAAAKIDRADYSRIEAGKLDYLSVARACRVGAVLGLDVSVRAFPGGRPIRDAGQATALQKLLEHVRPPLAFRTEVPLPRTIERPEHRAWDAVLYGSGQRTAIEFERRLYDLQAQLRRHRMKLRDDPVDHLLLVVSNTRANRRAVSEFTELLVDLPRLRTSTVLAMLRSGRHPPTGIMLFDALAHRRRQGP